MISNTISIAVTPISLPSIYRFVPFTIVYRPADKIAEGIRSGDSKVFDPDALKGFLKILPDTTTVCHYVLYNLRIE